MLEEVKKKVAEGGNKGKNKNKGRDARERQKLEKRKRGVKKGNK